MDPVSIGIIGIIILLILFVTKVPVAFAMGIMGFVGFSYLVSLNAGLEMVAVDLFDTFHPITLLLYLCLS
jgi:energy-coupling factor transporter transmembrane protein EcfT